MADAVTREESWQAGEKGLRSGALGMLSGIVIGVASTAPGYSLAAERGKALTDEALEQVAGSGVQATTAVVDARPAEGLLALADEHRARMIVIGTHGERPLMGVVLGSTPYKLLHRSPVPVLVVRAPDA